MDVYIALIMGIIQGLTEFLPVSSSGHLVLFGSLFDFLQDDGITFEIIVHLGTLVAVLLYFRQDVIMLLRSIVCYKDETLKENRMICLWLLVATLVTGILGFLYADIIIGVFFNPLVVAIMLVITGGILFISDKIKEGGVYASKLGVWKSLFIGLGQAVAIIPGISRSGTTIFFGLLAKLNRKQAAFFSFMLSIPAIIGATLLDVASYVRGDETFIMGNIHLYIVGFLAAFVSGYIVIGWLLKLIVRAKLRYFAYYCWGVSVIAFSLLVIGVLS
jgi:undecaprenyl-diphosphatase